jgi:hypothetical protein
MVHCRNGKSSIFRTMSEIEIQKKRKLKRNALTGKQLSPYMFVMGIEYEFNSII